MLIALTGGIGGGKSTAAKLFAARGAAVVDADLVAREVVDPQRSSSRHLLAELRGLLGDSAFGADGTLDRQVVAQRVFSDSELLTAYNALLRPALIGAMSHAIDRAVDESESGIVIHEIPLLSARTSPLPWRYDLIVTVQTRAAERRRRLIEDRGYAPDEADRRMAAQGTDEDRAAMADVVLRNEGSFEDLEAGVDALWRTLPAGRNNG